MIRPTPCRWGVRGEEKTEEEDGEERTEERLNINPCMFMMVVLRRVFFTHAFVQQSDMIAPIHCAFEPKAIRSW